MSVPRTGQRITQDQALALWREYKATGSLEVRNRLVLTFAPLVKYIVYKKIRDIPARYDVDDFISCGLEALIQSISHGLHGSVSSSITGAKNQNGCTLLKPLCA